MEISTFSENAQNSPWLRVHPLLRVSPIQFIFNALDGAYPVQFRKSFALEGDAGKIAYKNWESAMVGQLEFNKIRISELQSGLMRVPQLHPRFCPTPGEFILACRPAMDYEKAFYEAQRGTAARDAGRDVEYSSPAVFWAAADMSYEMRTTLNYAVVQAKWIACLDARLRQTDLPPVPVVVPAVEHRRIVTPTGQAAAINVRGVVKAAGDAIDHRGWVQRALAKAAAGEYVPYQTLKTAQALAGRSA